MGVKLRKKKLKGGKKSLYLDIHNNGEREYEFLGLYLTGDDKHDKDVLSQAEDIRKSYENKLKDSNSDRSFYTYFRNISEKNLKRGVRNHKAILDHIHYYHDADSLPFGEVTEEWIIGFREYLIENLHQNTAHNYFGILKTSLKDAVEKGIIHSNPADGVDIVGRIESELQYLMIDDIRIIKNRIHEDLEVKKAFLFATQTGISLGDLYNLEWGNIARDKVVFRQKRNGRINIVPLNKNALNIIGKRKWDEDKLFELPIRSTVWKAVKKWEQYLFDKELTFNMSRHTFAVMLLNNGTSLNKVADLLGISVNEAEKYLAVAGYDERAVENLPDL